MKQKKMGIILTRGKLVTALALGSMLCLSLVAQNTKDVKTPTDQSADGPQKVAIAATAPGIADGPQRVKLVARLPGVPDGPVRIKITARAKGYPSVSPEFEFRGANGMVTGLSATSERKTFTFEQEAAGMSCPRGKVKECDALKLKDGGSLTACVCLAPDKETPPPASGGADPASADMRYDISLSDGTALRSSGGVAAQTCWVNKKLQMSLCY